MKKVRKIRIIAPIVEVQSSVPDPEAEEAPPPKPKFKKPGPPSHRKGKHLPKRHIARISKTLSDGRRKGSKNIKAELDEEKVRKIKILLKGNKFKQVQIARYFEVSEATISYIKSGKIWTHVTVG